MAPFFFQIGFETGQSFVESLDVQVVFHAMFAVMMAVIPMATRFVFGHLNGSSRLGFNRGGMERLALRAHKLVVVGRLEAGIRIRLVAGVLDMARIHRG